MPNWLATLRDLAMGGAAKQRLCIFAIDPGDFESPSVFYFPNTPDGAGIRANEMQTSDKDNDNDDNNAVIN